MDVANSNNGGNNEVAKFIMYNGHITKNKGSGVYLNDSTSFTMYGGRITQNGYNNTSLFGGYGGGVYVASEASFTMYGGNITGNYANKMAVECMWAAKLRISPCTAAASPGTIPQAAAAVLTLTLVP